MKERLNEIINRVFEKEINLNAVTDIDDIDGWDSLMHLKICADIENEFNITFSFEEIARMETIEDIVSKIKLKCLCGK